MNKEGYTHIIKVDSIPEAWFQCVFDIFDDEKALADVWRVDDHGGSFAGCLRREFKSILVEIENPCDPDINKRIPMIPESMIIPNPIDPVIYPELKCSTCGEVIKNFRMLEGQYLTSLCNHVVDKSFYELHRPSCEQAVMKYFMRYLFSTELAINEQYTYGARILEPVNVPSKIKDPDTSEMVDNPIFKCLNDRFSSYKLGGHCEGGEIYYSTYPQFYYLCAYIITNPRSNQIILQIGKPSDVVLPDPPCCRSIDIRVKEGKINFYIYFRSWDLWGGFPLNLSGFSVLMDIMCGETGLEPGRFICYSKGLHLYEHSWSSALARLGRSTKNG